jgi:hypothetical protein
VPLLLSVRVLGTAALCVRVMIVASYCRIITGCSFWVDVTILTSFAFPVSVAISLQPNKFLTRVVALLAKRAINSFICFQPIGWLPPCKPLAYLELLL